MSGLKRIRSGPEDRAVGFKDLPPVVLSVVLHLGGISVAAENHSYPNILRLLRTQGKCQKAASDCMSMTIFEPGDTEDW